MKKGRRRRGSGSGPGDRPRASGLGRYVERLDRGEHPGPRRALTFGLSLSTRETVLGPTPACAATSLIVAIVPRCGTAPTPAGTNLRRIGCAVNGIGATTRATHTPTACDTAPSMTRGVHRSGGRVAWRPTRWGQHCLVESNDEATLWRRNCFTPRWLRTPAPDSRSPTRSPTSERRSRRDSDTHRTHSRRRRGRRADAATNQRPGTGANTGDRASRPSVRCWRNGSSPSSSNEPAGGRHDRVGTPVTAVAAPAESIAGNGRQRLRHPLGASV